MGAVSRSARECAFLDGSLAGTGALAAIPTPVQPGQRTPARDKNLSLSAPSSRSPAEPPPASRPGLTAPAVAPRPSAGTAGGSRSASGGLPRPIHGFRAPLGRGLAAVLPA